MKEMKIKFFENLQYLTLALLIVGQCTVSSSFWIGQGAYLGANIISVLRCFVLERPLSDKTKDVICLGITFSLMILKFIKALIC